MMIKEDLSTAKLLRYIGRIAIAFCQLEDEIELGIAGELHDDCDELGYMVTCKMNFQQKVDLYERLISYRLLYCNEVVRLKRFDLFMKHIKEMQVFRNDVVHNIRFNDEGEVFLRQRHRKSTPDIEKGIDELKLPRKGVNTRFPKFKQIELNELLFKKFLRRIEKACDRISDWDMHS